MLRGAKRISSDSAHRIVTHLGHASLPDVEACVPTLLTRIGRCSLSQRARCKGVRQSRGTAEPAELRRLSSAGMLIEAAKFPMNGAPFSECGSFGNRSALCPDA